MFVSGFSCVFVICISISQGSVYTNNNYNSKNGTMVFSNTNNIEKTSKTHITEFLDPQKNILAHKNEITEECILKLVVPGEEFLNFQSKYDSSMELSEGEMVRIIGENIRNFCKDKAIIFNNFEDDRLGRSKRSTDKKRYQGQTQTQFLSFGSKNSNQETKNGLAEALSQPDLSRATVSGLNGMGQAQSQSSFGDCDECSGQHPLHVNGFQPGSIPLIQPENQNLRPYIGSNINGQFPASQYKGSTNIGMPIIGQYPETNPSIGINNRVSGLQEPGYGNRPSVDAQYPSINQGSGINNRVPSTQQQGYNNKPVDGPYPGIYPGLGTNYRLPGTQEQGYGNRPSVGGQYPTTHPSSETSNRVMGKPDQMYGNRPFVNEQYPTINQGSGINNRMSGLQDQGYGKNETSEVEQYSGINQSSGTNIRVPGTQDQGYGVGSLLDGKYTPTNLGSGTNNLLHSNRDQGDRDILNNQYPSLHSGLENNNKLPEQYQRPGYNSAPENVPNSVNNISPQSRNTEDINKPNQNKYPVNSSQLNPSGWNYPNKVTDNPSNQQIYPGGSGFPSFPSGSSQGILAPYNTPLQNSEGLYTSKIPQVSVPTSLESQNRHPNHPSSSSFPLQNINGASQLLPNNPLPWNTLSGQDYTQLNLPSLCNYLYQTCLNALSNKRMNNLQTTSLHYNTQIPQQNNERNPSGDKQYGRTGLPSIQHNNPLYDAGINPSQNQPNFIQPQSILGTGGSDVQQSGYPPSNGYVYPSHSQPNYGHHRGILGTGESDIYQPGYPLSGGNINPNQIQPMGTFTTGGSGIQQPGYTPSGGNVNPNQIQPQGTFTTGGSGIQQPGYTPSGGNVNPNQIQPQGTFVIGGSGIQQPRFPPSRGNINPNQIQPQGTLPTGGSGIQQPGYPPSGGNVNPNQIQPQGTFATGGSGIQQPGYIPSGENLNPNQLQPQDTLGSEGSHVQQPGYVPSGENINPNQIQPQGTFATGGSGIQQPRFPPSRGNINPNQIQPQGTFATGGSGIQQPRFPPSRGNINPNQIQPQGTLPTGGSGIQQPGYPPSGGNVNPNQIQPQGTFATGGSGIQQPGYIPSGENLNPNQLQPQDTLGSEGSRVQQPGYVPSGENVNPNQMQINYGQPQGTLGSGGYWDQQSGYIPTRGDDGKGIFDYYPQSYGDKYYKGQQFGSGSQIGNNYPLSNPISGGQFGTDISSGGSVMPVDTEGGDTQSMTNVNVDGQETSASASAQGKSKSGTTQTQVSGTHLGTAMFTAQALTSDVDKGAQSQIVSNTNGTMSSAQGRGGKGKAQSQVTYNSESGTALGEAQSSGINYGTNSQLQAGIKGGLADAQSTGQGSTSSQAQIGFLPHESNNNTDQKSLFRGGGTASSQGGLYSGQSQSQLSGSYKHGISYNAAAQASSGRRLQELPKMNLTDAKWKIGRPDKSYDDGAKKTGAAQVADRQKLSVSDPPSLGSGIPVENSGEVENEERRDIVQKSIQTTSTNAPSSTVTSPQDLSGNFDVDAEYDEDDDDYYDVKGGEGESSLHTKSAQTEQRTDNSKQTQSIILNLDTGAAVKHDTHVTRASDDQTGVLKAGQVLDAGQIVPGANGTRIPSGFRGRVVTSSAGDRTEAEAGVPGGRAQSQTVLLTPGDGGLTVVDNTKLRALLAGKSSYASAPARLYDRFRTDADGRTGHIDPSEEKNVQYFTKSSTCGYFSFSCNYVNGVTKTGPKICKPNPPPFPCQRTN